MDPSPKCVRNTCSLVTKEGLAFAVCSSAFCLIFCCFCWCSGSDFRGKEDIPGLWECQGVDTAQLSLWPLPHPNNSSREVWLHWGHTQAKEGVDVGEGNTGENVPD